jgi:hypothetical protein
LPLLRNQGTFIIIWHDLREDGGLQMSYIITKIYEVFAGTDLNSDGC